MEDVTLEGVASVLEKLPAAAGGDGVYGACHRFLEFVISTILAAI